MMEFVIQPVPPFRLDLTVPVLRRLPLNAMDRWDGEVYSRTLAIDDAVAEVRVVQDRPARRPRLRVTVQGLRTGARNESLVRGLLERLLGANIDMRPFQRMAAADKHLAPIAARYEGFKPPRLGSLFETFVNGTACQQLSLIVGLTLLNRLSAAYGPAFQGQHAFPRPRDLRPAEPRHLRAMGFSERKARNILDFARDLDQGRIDPDAWAGLADDDLVARLLELPGIGRWTAQYIALRGYGRLDVLPADDVGLHARLQTWLDLKTRPDYAGIQKIVSRYSPYRGLLYFYLLLDFLECKGIVQGKPVTV